MAKVAKKSSYGWDPHLQRSKPRQMSGGASPARAACVVFACHPSGVFLASQRGKWACLEIWFGAEIIRSLFPKRFEKESNQIWAPSPPHNLHLLWVFFYETCGQVWNISWSLSEIIFRELLPERMFFSPYFLFPHIWPEVDPQHLTVEHLLNNDSLTEITFTFFWPGHCLWPKVIVIFCHVCWRWAEKWAFWNRASPAYKNILGCIFR